MSKSVPPSEETVQGWLKRGDGQGEGLNYKTFLQAHEFGSAGETWITGGVHVDRQYTYFSLLEYRWHVVIDFSLNVLDIREQVALLPREVIRKIARRLKIRVPLYPGSKILRVLTSDIVVTAKGPNGPRLHVFSIKYAVDIDPNIVPDTPKKKKQLKKVLETLEKLALEKAYWELQGATWELRTETTLPLVRFENLDKLLNDVLDHKLDRLNPGISRFASAFLRIWSANKSASWNNLMAACAKSLAVNVDDAFAMFARAVWTRIIPVDLDGAVLHHEEPIRLKDK